MKQEPSDDEVKEFVRNDANDDDYMLFEIVAGIEGKFRVPRPKAVLLTHKAITALLAEGIGELSFGHWEETPTSVPAAQLPSPDHEHWAYPPPDERFWFYGGEPG